MKNLAHSASFESLDKNAPSNAGTKHLVGRSEVDCYQVLRHINFPSGEVIWALQGFLKPFDDLMIDNAAYRLNYKQLESELVVGHAEYRRVANKESHFRRCFAELFRTRSLIFLGSGLAEPYFTSLFDEIIELTGPPLHPHFAVIPDGDIDTSFMRQQYNILCNTYPKQDHHYVVELLKKFKTYVLGNRTRPRAWGFRANSPSFLEERNRDDHFEVVRALLPHPQDVPNDDIVAISCGREEGETNCERGQPAVSSVGARAMRLTDASYEWDGDWVVKWSRVDRGFGIIARELIEPEKPSRSRDRRSPEAIRTAFYGFLRKMEEKNVRCAHVQLLSAGEGRAFQPWISLLQMARAYGYWVKQGYQERRARSLV